MSFFYLFLSSIRECLFDVNIYTSLPLALTANLITTVFYLFLRTDKLELLVYSDTKIIFCICTHCIFEKSNIVIRNTHYIYFCAIMSTAKSTLSTINIDCEIFCHFVVYAFVLWIF